MIDYRLIVGLIVTACVIICTIALGHLAWGW
jgi:hypothetical protein